MERGFCFIRQVREKCGQYDALLPTVKSVFATKDNIKEGGRLVVIIFSICTTFSIWVSKCSLQKLINAVSPHSYED